MKNPKWYIRHIWIRFTRFLRQKRAKMLKKPNTILDVQNVYHKLNINLGGGEIHGKINTR